MKKIKPRARTPPVPKVHSRDERWGRMENPTHVRAEPAGLTLLEELALLADHLRKGEDV